MLSKVSLFALRENAPKSVFNKLAVLISADLKSNPLSFKLGLIITGSNPSSPKTFKVNFAS